MSDPAGRRRLFYKPYCQPCRFLSRLAVILSLGAIRRVPLDSAEAAALHQQHPEWRGQLLMLGRDGVRIGPQVFRAVPLAVISVYWNLLKKPFTSQAGQP
jgi:hypothetical protein